MTKNNNLTLKALLVYAGNVMLFLLVLWTITLESIIMYNTKKETKPNVVHVDKTIQIPFIGTLYDRAQHLKC